MKSQEVIRRYHCNRTGKLEGSVSINTLNHRMGMRTADKGAMAHAGYVHII